MSKNTGWVTSRLGVREGQGFRIHGRPEDFVYWVEGRILWKEDQGSGLKTPVGSLVLMELLENPGLVIRSNDLTAEQSELLRCLATYFGYEWLAQDESGIVYAYQTKPTKAMSVWVRSVRDSLLPLAIRHHCAEGLVSWEYSEPMNIYTALYNNHTDEFNA